MRLWASSLMGLYDALELVFGPDPGLFRLQSASRAVGAAALALTILLLTTRGANRGAIAAIALGFMTATLSNVAVRDKGRGSQALTIIAMGGSALAASVLGSWLAQWRWVGETGFVAVVAAAALARLLGPRGFACGIAAFICYFIGEILHAPVSDAPLLAAGVAVGLGASALMRFVLLPHNPEAAVRHLIWHLRRRVARVLAEGETAISQGAGGRGAKRMHRELGRLNDAFQAASLQLEDLEEGEEADRLLHRVLAVELAAERVLRAAEDQRGQDSESAEDRQRNAARLGALARRLREGRLPSPRDGPAPAEAPLRHRRAPVNAAVDALESALAELRGAPA